MEADSFIARPKWRFSRSKRRRVGTSDVCFCRKMANSCGSKPMVPLWGRCTTHFKPILVGDWDVHCGYGLLTHSQMTRPLRKIRGGALDGLHGRSGRRKLRRLRLRHAAGASSQAPSRASRVAENSSICLRLFFVFVPLVGFKRNLSLLDISLFYICFFFFFFFFFSGGLNQMEEDGV